MRLQFVLLLQVILDVATNQSTEESTPTIQSYCTGDLKNDTVASSKFTCNIGKSCNGHWRVATVMVMNDDNSYHNFASRLDNLTSQCTSLDEVYFLSPQKYRQTNQCTIDHFKLGYFKDQIEEFPFNPAMDKNNTGDMVAQMLNIAETCLVNNQLKTNEGAIVYIFTDLSCFQLCSTSIYSAQSTFISKMVSLHYIVNIFGLNNETFQQCSAYSYPSWCQFLSVTSDTPICAPHSITTVDFAILIAVGIAILILLIVLFFYIRMRNRKKLLEKVRHTARIREAYLEHQEKEVSLDPWEFQPEELELFVEKELGRGAFAVVFEGKLKGRRPVNDIIPTAQLMSNRNDKVAVKRVPPHADLLSRRDFLDEINFMKQLGFHAHVLGMIGCMTTIDLPLIVLEFCENGDLLEFLKRNQELFQKEGGLRPKDLLSISWQISDGMCYIRSLDLIHRDLAARNILLTKDLSAKISDFGLCRQPVMSDSSSIYVSRGGRLPVKWMALESLRDFQFSFQTDIWSFGVVLWETFSLGETPFFEVNPTAMLEVLNTGKRLPQLETIPDFMYKLMSDCWKENPEERVTIEDARDRLNEALSASSLYYGYLSMSDDSLRL